jgi:hypothetical protein
MSKRRPWGAFADAVGLRAFGFGARVAMFSTARYGACRLAHLHDLLARDAIGSLPALLSSAHFASPVTHAPYEIKRNIVSTAASA